MHEWLCDSASRIQFLNYTPEQTIFLSLLTCFATLRRPSPFFWTLSHYCYPCPLMASYSGRFPRPPATIGNPRVQSFPHPFAAQIWAEGLGKIPGSSIYIGPVIENSELFSLYKLLDLEQFRALPSI